MPRWTKGKIAKDKVGKKGADVGDYLLQHGKTANTVNFGHSTPGGGGVSTNMFVVPDGLSIPFKRARSTAARPPSCVFPFTRLPCEEVPDIVRCSPADDSKGLVCQNKKVVKELACDPGMHCIGPAADGPNGEKRVACL